MRRISTFIMMMVLTLAVMGQNKLTPQALLKVERAKSEAVQETDGTKKNVRALKNGEPITAKFVVMVKDDADMASTVSQMKAVGAVVQSRLGRQLVVNLPVEKVSDIEQVKGVERIDAGHKGRKKTDVSRVETGVSQLNGPSVPENATPYTGKGVTICLFDGGFDFQHAQFKDAQGNTRIKCVYMMSDEGGNKFTVDDPEIGEYTFPGSIYDTPELIAKLTTDDTEELHGTHTAGIAAGSISPMGFGGMAPEADIVLIPMQDEVEGLNSLDEVIELGLSFAAAYAKKIGKPMIFSGSINSHAGPHDGTSDVCKAIDELSKTVIPVFATGNEGDGNVYIHQLFTKDDPSFETVMLGTTEDDENSDKTKQEFDVNGITVAGKELTVQVSFCHFDALNDKTTTVWTSREFKGKLGEDPDMELFSDKNTPELAKYFKGDLSVGVSEYGSKGQLCVNVVGEGIADSEYWFVLKVSAPDGTDFHLWNDSGFEGDAYGPNLKGGTSEISGGDWTSSDRVISVGAYCANVLSRASDGSVENIAKDKEENDEDGENEEYGFAKYRSDEEYEESDEVTTQLNGIASSSSYGKCLNGISQPVICAPGVNVVSGINRYALEEDYIVAESMAWNGSPYTAEDGTSMACPTVSGIVALWMEARPDLDFDTVKKVLSKTARNDEYTKILPDRWGFGKIDAAKGLDYLLNSTGIDMVSQKETISNYNYAKGWYTFSGTRLSGKPAAKGLYIHNGKKVFIK